MEAERPPNRKEKLTIAGQIEDLRRRGVRFDAGEVELARDCLAHRRSLLHLSAYRTLFPKHLEGPHKGKYIDLSFGDLLVLDELDAQIRDTFLYIALQAESATKMQILATVSEIPEEDGYAIVTSFLESLPNGYASSLKRDFIRRSKLTSAGGDLYMGNLIEHYLDEMPIWVLAEIVTFGPLLSMYRFCSIRWNRTDMLRNYYVLKPIKEIRNACGHQNCIINGLTRKESLGRYVTKEVRACLMDSGLASTAAQKNKLKNPRLQQLISALYFAKGQSSADREMMGRILLFRNRTLSVLDRYVSPVIYPFRSSLAYLLSVIDTWFPIDRDE